MLCVIIFLKIEINTIIDVEIMWLYYFRCMNYANIRFLPSQFISAVFQCFRRLWGFWMSKFLIFSSTSFFLNEVPSLFILMI